MIKEEKIDLIARITWLYYVAEKTQLEIAQMLNLSRQIVQRYLSLAKNLNIVEVKIVHPLTSCLTLANEIQKKYHLDLCHIVPSAHLADIDVTKMIAVEGAQVLDYYLRDEGVKIVGVGSGKTLKQIIELLPKQNHAHHRIVSLIGSFNLDGLATQYDIPLRLAEKLSCPYFILPAPLYVENEEDKRLWCKHKTYQNVYHYALKADVIFIGVGEIGLNCPLNTEGFITNEQILYLQKQDIVAELLGFFINRKGEFQKNDLENLTTSFKIDPILNKKIICFAGGEKKYNAIQAILKGHLIKGLVTDELTAQKLLQ